MKKLSSAQQEVVDILISHPDWFDMADKDKEDAEYTIKPVYMTIDEFNELPEWEG